MGGGWGEAAQAQKTGNLEGGACVCGGGVSERERLRTAAGHSRSDSTAMEREEALEIHGSERPSEDSLPVSIPLCDASMWRTHVCERDACVCVPVCVCMCLCACVYVCMLCV